MAGKKREGKVEAALFFLFGEVIEEAKEYPERCCLDKYVVGR